MTPVAPTTRTAAPEFEVYDFITCSIRFANSFAEALRLMRSLYDAKLTRISDNVVLAQTQSGADSSAVLDCAAAVESYEAEVTPLTSHQEIPYGFQLQSEPDIAAARQAALDTMAHWQPAMGYDEAAEQLAPELEDAVEYITRDCLVHVTPLDKTIRPFYGVVQVVFEDEQKALVKHISGRVYDTPFTIDEMKLIYSAEVRSLETETALR